MDLDRFKRLIWLRKLYLKSVLPLKFPIIMNIEPTNRCNLACTMCPRGGSGRSLSDLDWGLFERLCDEMAREGPVRRVFLQKDGEPLLHPRIAEMVARLKQRRAAKNVAIITNGTLLTTRRFEELAAAGLDDLIVSIDAVDPETYRTLKGADRYTEVVGNVEAAIALKRSKGLRLPLIKARMVDRAGHAAEVEAFRGRWNGVADAVDITPYHTWIGAVDDCRTYTVRDRYPCSLLWYTGIVNADGTVSPCCIDFSCQGVVGRVGEGGFKAVWNGMALNRLRRQHLQGTYQKTAICGPCDYWLIKEDLGAWLRRKHRLE